MMQWRGKKKATTIMDYKIIKNRPVFMVFGKIGSIQF
jgi:hypothetical protein